MMLILQVIRSVCQLILASSTARQLAETQTEAQRQVINTHCFSLLLHRILRHFVPLDAAPLVGIRSYLVMYRYGV